MRIKDYLLHFASMWVSFLSHKAWSLVEGAAGDTFPIERTAMRIIYHIVVQMLNCGISATNALKLPKTALVIHSVNAWMPQIDCKIMRIFGVGKDEGQERAFVCRLEMRRERG